ncbi:RNase adapter RapZ [Lachnospiraceae bacterium 38-10]
MRFVVVTGMSGGGKSTALKMLEDAGFYCVDNLPFSLVGMFVEMISLPGTEASKVALGLDVRSGQSFQEAEKVLDKLKENGFVYEILFLDASERVLLKRYKETRRRHPLSLAGERVGVGIQREREILREIREKADYVIDTSNLLTRELKTELERIFVRNEEYNSLMINIVSFGFKYGIPADVDLVFDVRFLPNPFYVEELKYHTGNEKEVQDFVMGYPESHEFLDKLNDMLLFLIPNYIREGKYQLVIGVGCTGGRHRSVTLANMLFERLKDKGDYGLKLSHRDVEIK